MIFHPLLGDVEAMGVAPEGAQLIASGLSAEVAETILQSRASSMKKRLNLKYDFDNDLVLTRAV